MVVAGLVGALVGLLDIAVSHLLPQRLDLFGYALFLAFLVEVSLAKFGSLSLKLKYLPLDLMASFFRFFEYLLALPYGEHSLR